MASIALLSNQKVELFAQALDANSVQVDFTAPPIFTVSDPTVGSVVDIADTDPQPVAGQFAKWFVPLKAGNCTVTVTEDAVAGDDTTQLTGSIDFVITVPVPPVDLGTSVAISSGAPVSI